MRYLVSIHSIVGTDVSQVMLTHFDSSSGHIGLLRRYPRLHDLTCLNSRSQWWMQRTKSGSLNVDSGVLRAVVDVVRRYLEVFVWRQCPNMLQPPRRSEFATLLSSLMFLSGPALTKEYGKLPNIRALVEEASRTSRKRLARLGN